MSLQSEYKNRYDKVLNRLAEAIAEQVQGYLRSEPRIDRVTGRAKDVVSFLDKARREENGKRKYSEPLSQIQDQIGVRIITFYTSDVTPQVSPHIHAMPNASEKVGFWRRSS